LELIAAFAFARGPTGVFLLLKEPYLTIDICSLLISDDTVVFLLKKITLLSRLLKKKTLLLNRLKLMVTVSSRF
jgi:hypothetical protein